MSESVGSVFIAVGASHLDAGSIPAIGKTGILNFLQAIKESEMFLGGMRVTNIQRFVGDSWVDVTVSTEGPYLEGFMTRLKSEAASGGGGAASSAGVSLGT